MTSVTLSSTHTPCVAQGVTVVRQGCILHGEQMENGGFELCSFSYWYFNDPVLGFAHMNTRATSPLNWTIMENYGLQSDDVRSGRNAMRVVFKDDAKTFAARVDSESVIRTCAERSYVWSFWAKQGTANACTIDFNFQYITRGIFTPDTQWTKFEGRIDVGLIDFTSGDGSPNWLINCAAGGLERRVLLDDFSFQQVNGASLPPVSGSDPVQSSVVVATPTVVSQTPLGSIVISSSMTGPATSTSLVASTVSSSHSHSEPVVTTSSTLDPLSSTLRASSITPAPVSTVSSTSPSLCTPTIIDGAFEGSVGEGLSVYTNNATDAVFDIKYKHSIFLCAGVSYDVSVWATTNRVRPKYSEGCRVTAMVGGQQAFSDRIGYHDWDFRYVHGTIIPSVDVPNAELYFRVTCRTPQYPTFTAPRGVILNEVAVVPASQWKLPAAAEKPTASTSVYPEETGTPTVVFPNTAPCRPTQILPSRYGCELYGEQIPDPGFEICTNGNFGNWYYRPPGKFYDSDSALTLDKQLTQLVTDEKHSGTRSIRLVFDSAGGSVGVFSGWAGFSGCAERSYAYSLWSKQATANACTIDFFFGAIHLGSTTPPVGAWGNFEGRLDATPFGLGKILSGFVEVRVSCLNGGGLNNAVWVDDVSYHQVEYAGPTSA